MLNPMPPLNPLRTFEVAARSRTFTEAAEELRVTQAAVSRQIGVLEAFFGAKLFERDVRSIRLTLAGKQLQKQISPAFEIIRWASQRLLEDRQNTAIRIQAYPTFSVRWLMPRLSDFMASHPDVNIRVETAIKPGDFLTSDVDLRILFGHGRWDNMSAHPLVRDEVEPVCSPRLFGERTPENAADLGKHTLLHSKYRRQDWTDWISSAGIGELHAHRNLTFESSLLTYQAAIEGIGVAMGQTRLLRSELESGVLICPIDVALRRDLHYWLVWPEHRRLNRNLRRFVDWLISQSDVQEPNTSFESSSDRQVPNLRKPAAMQFGT